MAKISSKYTRGVFKNYEEIYCSPIIVIGQLTLELYNDNINNFNL